MSDVVNNGVKINIAMGTGKVYNAHMLDMNDKPRPRQWDRIHFRLGPQYHGMMERWRRKNPGVPVGWFARQALLRALEPYAGKRDQVETEASHD